MGTAGGKLLLELNRVLRPGGYFVWSATPVYRTVPEDVAIWKGRLLVIYLMFLLREMEFEIDVNRLFLFMFCFTLLYFVSSLCDNFWQLCLN